MCGCHITCSFMYGSFFKKSQVMKQRWLEKETIKRYTEKKKKRETERLIKSSLSHAIVVRRENHIFKNVYL